MSANGNYPIWIGVANHPDHDSGRVEIGAKSVDWLVAKYGRGNVEVEKVYGIQLRHRCAALDETGAWRLMLPSAAKARGLKMVRA